MISLGVSSRTGETDVNSMLINALLATSALMGTGANAAVISGTGNPLTDPALANGTQITFDEVQTLPFTQQGVTFTSSGTAPIAIAGYFATEGSFGTTPVVTFTFDRPVTAVAFNMFYAVDAPWTFSIFSGNALRDSVLLTGIPAGEYIGFSGTGITSATLSRSDESGENILIDNLTFRGVPEPSTWAMMLLGLGAVGMAMRRKRAALPHVLPDVPVPLP